MRPQAETRAELKGTAAEVMAEMRHHYAATLSGLAPATREIVELLMESAACGGYVKGYMAGSDYALGRLG
jgi:hypothetical protein